MPSFGFKAVGSQWCLESKEYVDSNMSPQKAAEFCSEMGGAIEASGFKEAMAQLQEIGQAHKHIDAPKLSPKPEWQLRVEADWDASEGD